MARKRNSRVLQDLFWVLVISSLAIACEDHVNAAPLTTQYVEQGLHWDKYSRFNSHPLVTELGLTLTVDSSGNIRASNGNDVVLLGDGKVLISVDIVERTIYLTTETH